MWFFPTINWRFPQYFIFFNWQIRHFFSWIQSLHFAMFFLKQVEEFRDIFHNWSVNYWLSNVPTFSWDRLETIVSFFHNWSKNFVIFLITLLFFFFLTCDCRWISSYFLFTCWQIFCLFLATGLIDEFLIFFSDDQLKDFAIFYQQPIGEFQNFYFLFCDSLPNFWIFLTVHWQLLQLFQDELGNLQNFLRINKQILQQLLTISWRKSSIFPATYWQISQHFLYFY